MDIMILIAYLRHLGETDGQEHHRNHHANDQIRRHQHTQVGILQRLKLSIAQQSTLVAAHRIETGLDEVHRHVHADDGATGVEALRHIQAPGGRRLRAHRQDIGVATRLQEREATGHDEIGNEEAAIDAHRLGREEQQGTNGIEAKPHQYTGLIGVLADEDGCGKGHTEIAAVEGHLHQRAVGDTHPEYLRERLHHRIGDVVGKAPQGKAKRHKDEGDEIFRGNHPSPVPSRWRGGCTVV